MDNFIEQLYYGNINPQARCCPNGSEALEIQRRVSTLEEVVRSHLSDSDKYILDDFCKAQLDLLCISNLDAFMNGFRLGAKMAVDTFCTETAPFEQIRE